VRIQVYEEAKEWPVISEEKTEWPVVELAKSMNGFYSCWDVYEY
jgi:hypothetical protein